MKLDIKDKFSKFRLPKLRPLKTKQKNEKPVKENKNTNKGKALLLAVIFIGTAVFTYTQLLGTDSSTDKADKVIKTSTEMTKMVNKSALQKPKENVSFSDSNIALTSENPFVNVEKYQNVSDMSKSKQEKLAEENSKNLPAIPNYTPSAYLPDTGLPAIPTFDIPNIKTQKIQGIMSDENGNKLAIVDGKIIQEGDDLNGTTISKINNKGITFDNGNQISYNIAN